jgi:two-component system, NarL family, nitrate/nitrite response regulator NarL
VKAPHPSRGRPQNVSPAFGDDEVIPGRPAGRPAVLLASPSGEHREGWRKALEKEFLVFEAATRERLIWQLAQSKPNVVLLDDALHAVRGPEGLQRLTRLAPGAKLVVLARTPDRTRALADLRAGAKGYCAADISRVLLRKLVSRILAGEIWIGRLMISSLLDELVGVTGPRQPRRPGPVEPPDSGGDRLGRLSPRELDVVRILAHGFSNKEIANALQLAEKTVKCHLTAVFRKLGLSRRLQVGLLFSASSHPLPARPDQGRIDRGLSV